MASKVIVKMPVVQFSQVNKSNVGGDLVALPRPPEVPVRNVDVKGSDASRVAQLEQNIRFLQEQHQVMLTGLHKEIDTLKHKNRELQFQLVFSKSSVPSSPSSSSEDDSKHKTYTSPSSLNITPLQVELLEKELGELKLQMQDIENRNTYLSAIVDEQKKKLETYELDLSRARSRPEDLARKLEDSEALVRKLHRENSDLRRETSSSHRENPSVHRDYYPREPQRGKGGNSRYRGNYKGNWFPPLHTQSYWSGGRGSDRGNAGASGETSLPTLNGGGGRSSNNNYRSNGGGGGKYRGQNKGHKPS